MQDAVYSSYHCNQIFEKRQLKGGRFMGQSAVHHGGEAVVVGTDWPMMSSKKQRKRKAGSQLASSSPPSCSV